jgi:hypothetical protein
LLLQLLRRHHGGGLTLLRNTLPRKLWHHLSRNSLALHLTLWNHLTLHLTLTLALSTDHFSTFTYALFFAAHATTTGRKYVG